MNVVAWCGSSSNIRNRNNSSVNIFSILSLLALASFPTSFRPLCRRKHFLELSLRKLAAQPSSAPIITGRLSELSLAKRSKTLWPTFDFIVSRFLRCQKSSLLFLAVPQCSCILSPQNCATFPLLLLAHILCRRHALVATELLVLVPLLRCRPLCTLWLFAISFYSAHFIMAAACLIHFLLLCLLISMWQIYSMATVGAAVPPSPSTSLPAGLGPSEALKCAFRAARWAASLHSSLIV